MENVQVKLFNFETVVVGKDRQRSEFEEKSMESLYYRIKDDGLMHPPGISTEENMTLIYGERRFRCLRAMAKQGIPIKFNGQELPVGMIPLVVTGETDPLRLEELELSENVDRSDLTWQEKARAVSRIQSILEARKEREAAVKSEETGVEVKPELVKIAEVAAANKTGFTAASQALAVAEHLDDPDVSKAKSLKEAQKIIEKKRAQQYREEKAKTTVVNQNSHRIFHGDVRDVIKTLPDKLFTAIVTDPPYGIEMHKDQSWDGTWHEYNDDESYCMNLFHTLIPEWDRISKDQAHLYAFCDFSMFEKIRALFTAYRIDEKGKVGFLVSYEAALAHNMGLKIDPVIEKTKAVWDVMYFPFIWDKKHIASYPRPEHWPRKSYECCLYAIKGNHTQTKLDLAVLTDAQVQNQLHPAGKPKELYQTLIERSTMAGDYVFDGFAGQGNFVRAAHAGKRIAYAVELSETYYAMLVEAYSECE